MLGPGEGLMGKSATSNIPQLENSIQQRTDVGTGVGGCVGEECIVPKQGSFS